MKTAKISSEFFISPVRSVNQPVFHPLLEEKNVFLTLKREDQIDADVSGNKFRKLKYNILQAKKEGHSTLLTFGGAFSNHIAATAAAGKLENLRTIGIIRGEELAIHLEKTMAVNPTLNFAKSNNMQLKFISRSLYREKESSEFLKKLQDEFGDFYLLPEGGTNALAIKGCEEILTEEDHNYDYISCAVGTGGTLAGIINSSQKTQKTIGFPALKGDFLKNEIEKHTSKKNWHLETQYHFGGYGKINEALIEFINTFRSEQKILLDPVYTAKMIYGIFDMIKQDVFKKNTRILAIHTGGLQGISGMNKRLFQKGMQTINTQHEI